MNEKFAKLGFYPADILLPKDADMNKWSVVACDQFTSEPEYWQAVAENAGDAPSALKLILPEAHLNDPDVEQQIASINENMYAYLQAGLFRTYENAVFYIERTQSDGKIRRGLIGMVDLEQYDFTPGSGALIRATEGTVLSRIPPRVKVRKDAPIELPHIMLLIDDDKKTVIEPLAAAVGTMEKVYDFELQQGGGALKGWLLTEAQQDAAADALVALQDQEAQAEKYGLKGAAPLLFAVGDGNHSLATAKRCYEDLKKVTPADQWASLPARYALVEVVNNHDDALGFEPIHRVLFGIEPQDVLKELKNYYKDSYIAADAGTELSNSEQAQVIGVCFGGEEIRIVLPKPSRQLAVGTLQDFLDDYVKKTGCEIDYIHDDDVVRKLAAKPGNIGFMLPAMRKTELFKTVMADGVLPRKTFSMGHARDKRYYTEARKIR